MMRFIDNAIVPHFFFHFISLATQRITKQNSHSPFFYSSSSSWPVCFAHIFKEKYIEFCAISNRYINGRFFCQKTIVLLHMSERDLLSTVRKTNKIHNTENLETQQSSERECAPSFYIFFSRPFIFSFLFEQKR